MSMLSDYKRMVEAPMIRSYEATISKLRADLQAAQADAGGERLRAALEALEPFAERLKDTFPDDADESGITIKVKHLRRASLALSGGAGEQGLGSSNASRAAQGTDSLAAPEAEPSAQAWLRDVGGHASDGQWDECWVPCARGDPGARLFVYEGASAKTEGH